MSRLNFERSSLTQGLIDLLRGVNGEISYESLAQAVGVSVERVKPSLASARRILVEEGIHFGAIQGVGLRRLEDVSLSVKARSDIKKISRSVGRGEKVISSIQEFSKLPIKNQQMVTTARLIYENFKSGLKEKPVEEPVVVSRGSPVDLSSFKKSS